MLVVSPNNPTGSFLGRDELDGALRALCAAHGLALIGDEVFADYPLDAAADAARAACSTGPRRSTFSLGGLSKIAGLPQVKLGWIAVGGPRRPRSRPRSRGSS